MLNAKNNDKKRIDLLSLVFLIGIILVSSGCVVTLHFADAKKSKSTGDTGGGGTPSGGTPSGGTPSGGTPSGGTPSGGTPSGGTPSGGTPSGGTPSGGTGETGTGGTGGTQPPPATPPQQQPLTIKGPIQQQLCAASGVVALVDCQQVMNIKNIHNTVVRGSNYAIGAPGTSANGATPTVLYIQGVGYVELTAIQNAGNGQATITYFVLVPTK